MDHDLSTASTVRRPKISRNVNSSDPLAVTLDGPLNVTLHYDPYPMIRYVWGTNMPHQVLPLPSAPRMRKLIGGVLAFTYLAAF